MYPGIAVRTACGDNSTLNNYPVSSEDWQIRNGYTKPVAIVWRVPFFDKATGKNAMGGWMLEHLQSGEISDGWTVVAGHCQEKNTLFVQLKCMAPEGQEGKQCFKDANGDPYPLRSADAFRGDHKPPDSQVSNSVTPAQKAAPQIFYYMFCLGSYNRNPNGNQADYQYVYVTTEVFTWPALRGFASDPNRQFEQWLKESSGDKAATGNCNESTGDTAEAFVTSTRADYVRTHTPSQTVSWRPQ
jgi:hypothetical protein